MGVDAVLARMAGQARELRRARDARLAFHAVYLRTTEAIAEALRAGMFADAGWVDRWDVAFARLYLDALEADQRGEPVPAPWAVAFGTAKRQPGLPAVRHVLLGMNAHINYDLPQALLAVISDEEFADPAVRAAREADHRRIDEVLAERVRAEDAELQRLDPVRTWRDRVLQPLNRMATRRFLREARAKVWANALELSRARRAGPGSYARRLAELEDLSGRRVADLVRPGPVLLRLAVGGFGVRLAAEGTGAAPPGQSVLAGQPAPAPSGTGRVRRRHQKARNPRSFDPLRVGRMESALWVAYYRREWARFLVLSVRLVRGTFGMDWIRTLHGAWLVLRANQLWAPSQGDPDGARRCMSRFYGLLRLTYGEPANPAHAARLEVEWWAVHREHQRGADGDSGPLVTALARLYAYAYGTDEEAVRPAAEHRATAMDISDRWVAEGRAPDSPLLPAERAELVRSYAALLAAVHR
jgi:hypothetical protein